MCLCYSRLIQSYIRQQMYRIKSTDCQKKRATLEEFFRVHFMLIIRFIDLISCFSFSVKPFIVLILLVECHEEYLTCKKLSDKVLVWLSEARCRWFAYGSAFATTTLISCFIIIY